MNKQSAEAILETQGYIMTALDTLESTLLKCDPQQFDQFRRLYGKASRIIWNHGLTLSAPIKEAQDELRQHCH